MSVMTMIYFGYFHDILCLKNCTYVTLKVLYKYQLILSYN